MRSHLALSPHNEVIFTDFALQEAFKDANSKGLHRTFRPVKDFPSQIVALKKTTEICLLEPRSEGSPQRFVDELQSNRLRTYLHDIYSNAYGVHARIELGSTQAAQRFQILLPAIPQVRKDIAKQIESIPSEDIALLRTENKVTHRLVDMIVQSVIDDTALYLRDIGLQNPIMSYDIVYSFVLRFVLANHISGLFWGMRGGHASAKDTTLRNDVTDASYAAYATFFDGLITRDDKLSAVYRNTRLLLREGFGLR